VTVQKERVHLNDPALDKLPEPVDLRPGRVDEDGVLDWDSWLDNSPPRPEQPIVVRLEYAGRDVPLAANPSLG
jgi:hypothetical protein